MKTSNRLSWVVAIIGLWQLISPFILGYTANTTAMWNAIIVGIIFIVLGVWSALVSNAGTSRVLDWISFIVGLWLIVSPFVLGFSILTIAMWDAVIVGIVNAVLSIWAALSIRSYETAPRP